MKSSGFHSGVLYSATVVEGGEKKVETDFYSTKKKESDKEPGKVAQSHRRPEPDDSDPRWLWQLIQSARTHS